MPRKARTKNTANNRLKKNQQNWTDLLRLDESYSSLILGIVVVIFASIILVSFVRQRNIQNLQKDTSSISIAPTVIADIPLTISPTIVAGSGASIKPTVEPTQITQSSSVTPTPVISKPSPTKTVAPKVKTYTVKAGDDLWDIASAQYGSGYNWVDIAQANNLNNPGQIYSGNVLKLPTVTEKIPAAQVVVNNPTNAPPAQAQSGQTTQNVGAAITGNSYVVQKGDCLWNIAVRAYNDGYQWTKIAQANNLANPDMIFSGNVFIIPRA
ncbi:MAG TPA: LysM peptidoglycan-binding domain-containing protein [Patescibacteria group bacterium]|nr:LysM peptidoglycan-binding domain-containing protein [Patescibacteria group bacterium]